MKDEKAEVVEEEPMAVDTCEDCWARLHDIAINGSELSYIGKGISIHDNGLAQANSPLTPLNHYFEIKIVNPGESCYIAIGLARKDYPLHKHPGWNRGSIAYHADDGKIFIGSGIGSPFGPRARVNDVLGCGIVFPSAYPDPPENEKGQKKRWPWDLPPQSASVKDNPYEDMKKRRRRRRHAHNHLQYNRMDNAQQYDYSSESEDDIWWNNKNNVYEDKVKVFFMRNSKLLGIKEVRIPLGGFYPTIGLMSTNEKVVVDLHPLTG